MLPLGRPRGGAAVAADAARVVVRVVGAVAVHGRAAAVVGGAVAAAVGVVGRVDVGVARARVGRSVRAVRRAETADAVCAAVRLAA